MEGIRETNFGSCGWRLLSIALAGFMLLGTTDQAFAQAIPQENVDAIGPTRLGTWYAGNPLLQQNEPELVESLVYPGHFAIGCNDYRGVNDPAIGDAWPCIATSTDDGSTWNSGLIPSHLVDSPNLGQRGGADPNLEIAPHILYYNHMAFTRDGSEVSGLYIARFYEPNREVGEPFRFLDHLTVVTGTTSRLHDKPSFKLAGRDPDENHPDVQFQIPAFIDPVNPTNSHAAYPLNVPAHRLHLCVTLFVGNDNNDGTKVECFASDDGGVTFPIKNKLSSGVEINQGTSIATRNFGQDVVVVWLRFQDHNEDAAVMFAMSTDFGTTFGPAREVAQVCPFNQPTGAARFRTNALPVIVNSGPDDFAVYVASRNDATETCFIPGKGNKPGEPRMSHVMLADDFDNFGEDTDLDDNRIKDGMVRTSLNFSRIMMIRGSGNNNLSWDTTPVAIDPQQDTNESGETVRKRSHQFMPACAAAQGFETCSYFDTRLDKFNTIMQGLPAQPFVEDMVLHLEPGLPLGDPNAKVTPTLLPAGAYEGVPDPSKLPPNRNNIPLRHTLEQFVTQVQHGGTIRQYTVNRDTYYATDASDLDGIPSNSVRMSQFATRQKPGAPAGTREQVEWSYGGARMFSKGKHSFIGDYNSVAGRSMRQRFDLEWVPNEPALDPLTDLFSSREPGFRAAWTSNHKVRGKVYYTGCDVWDPDLQMWIAGAGCDSTYTEPGTLMPLEGEDGTNDGPPLTCSMAVTNGKARAPLTRNQTIMTAALLPDISAKIVSAIKPADGSRSTFVLQLRNGTLADRTVILTVPPGEFVSFGADMADSILSIPVVVPANTGNVRTVFDFGNLDTDPDLASTVILEVTDAGTGEILARVPLLRETLETPPLENVQSNPDPGEAPVDLLTGGEFYDLILKREIGVDPDFATLGLESFDLENTPELFDLENLDFGAFDLENTLIFFDLENFELENTNLTEDLYQAFDLENIVVNLSNLSDDPNRLLYFDLENFELENFELENFELENFELENFELENFELENFELENFELENESVFASGISNFELENFELENAAPGDDVAEVNWTVDSSANTTTGVDIKPIFTLSMAQDLVAAGSTVLLTVRRGYLTPTVGFANSLDSCTAEIIVDNQILYAAILSADQILASAFLGSVNDPDPLQADTPGFFMPPDSSTVINLRVINPPADLGSLSSQSGIALFTQPGASVNCDAELPGNEIDDLCEVDFTPPDTIPPVITLTGAASISIDQGAIYSDPGATANDDTDGDLTTSIMVSGWNFDTSLAGTFTIFYDVSDAEGNMALTLSRTVTVVDTEAPDVTLIGADPLQTEAGFPFADPGATATDNVGVVGPVDSDASTSVDTSTVGDYIVAYTATDAEGNSGTATRTVQVRDTIAPVISLLGIDPVTLEAGQAYIEPGATVSDDGDPGVTVDIDASSVNTAMVGSYTVTYDATDASGNAAIQVTRTVDVVDTSSPIIDPLTSPDFTPPEPFILGPDDGATFTAAWPVTASDPNPMLTASCVVVSPSGDSMTITPDSVISAGGSVEFTFSHEFELGTSNVTCTALDQGGNSASGSFVVSVEDIPVIDSTTVPASLPPVDANDPSGYVGPTAGLWPPVLATDGIDGSITAVCTPENDLALGPNTITCIATDSAGIESAPETFAVTVADLSPPSISVIDDPFVVPTIEASADLSAAELKANITATDIVDGIIDPANISCTVNGGASADLPVGIHAGAGSCVATDQAGNASVAVVFDVEVRFELDFTLIIPNGNKRAGSTMPIDFYYEQPGTDIRVDASGFAIEVAWFGPFSGNNCSGTNTGSGDGMETNDAGNSSFRWSVSQLLMQYSWQTPDQLGSYELVVSPPGTEQSTECVNLR